MKKLVRSLLSRSLHSSFGEVADKLVNNIISATNKCHEINTMEYCNRITAEGWEVADLEGLVLRKFNQVLLQF